MAGADGTRGLALRAYTQAPGVSLGNLPTRLLLRLRAYTQAPGVASLREHAWEPRQRVRAGDVVLCRTLSREGP